MMIENSSHQRIGVDFKTRKFVNEIAGAHSIERDGGVTFVLPLDKSGKPYTVTLAGRTSTASTANLSMTGPGFVVGVRKLSLLDGEFQVITLSSTELAVIQPRNGPTPQLFLTAQSVRSTPSYRFEVDASSHSRGVIMFATLDMAAGRLNFKSTERTRSSFNFSMRRTKPDGSRETYKHSDVSFSDGNDYTIDFGKWDGKGDLCFYDVSARNAPCSPLKNEAPAKQPN